MRWLVRSRRQLRSRHEGWRRNSHRMRWLVRMHWLVRSNKRTWLGRRWLREESRAAALQTNPSDNVVEFEFDEERGVAFLLLVDAHR
jgi:hypothetical protein